MDKWEELKDFLNEGINYLNKINKNEEYDKQIIGYQTTLKRMKMLERKESIEQQ
jgi:hypothetical protein